ncbi:hypothetical protein GCM10023169_28130 [Georgenia halophila]|uniref:Fibronectin type-III domain-containing protein n=1 Tax=Georgenia halophila TaxID=620889 RepID=A0ABP8LDR8_9MICO
MLITHRLRVAGTATAAALFLTTVTATGVSAAPPVSLRFDFQPAGAPLAEGFTEVTTDTAYTTDLEYGFTSTDGLGDRDRGSDLDALRRDFVLPVFDGSTTFVADVPNGSYQVTTWSGDGIASSRTSYVIEGVEHGDDGASAGEIVERTFAPVVVEDGQLTVVVSGSSPRLNGIEILSTLPAPAGLTATSRTEPPAVDLSWQASDGATGYRVHRTGESGEPTVVAEPTGTSFTDTDVKLAGRYTYQVTALDEATGRESQASDPIEVAVVDPSVTPPATPSGLDAVDVGRNQIDLAWNAVEAAVAYDVQRATSAGGPFTTVERVAGVTYTDSDVLTTREYHYRVVAVNAGGTSAPSEVLTTEAVTTLVRQAERLDRAPVAIATDDGVHVSWRHLGTDPADIAFHVYRDGVRITDAPVTGATNLSDTSGTTDSTYVVTVVGEETETPVTEEFGVWSEQYLDIPLDKPAGGVTPDGVAYEYVAGDASVGDLDGDGQYEIVMLWNPTNAKDNSQSGITGNVYVDALELDGTRLWRIDLGRNIRAGAHYTQLVVFDLDGDGQAEVMTKTADGTVDGQGTVIGDPEADHRNDGGYILSGPEYLTLFDGETGAAVDTVDYVPARGDVAGWGDDYGNRVDRFLAGVAYLDGEHPSAIFSRGYYTRAVIAAWDVVDGQLQQRWVFDSDEAGSQYEGQGNHNLSVADVDGDQLDEIVFGSMTIDHDGTVLYNTGLGHGDALHVSDLNPARDGLEVFAVHEDLGASGGRGATMRDAATGEVLWGIPATTDTGRGAAGDIDPRHPGAEAWAVGGDAAWDSPVGYLMSADGTRIGDEIPAANFLTWWDGDLLREITDHEYDADSGSGIPTVSDWDWQADEEVVILRDEELRSNNGTKGSPVLQADLLGDWREELIFRHADSSALRLYTTTDLTDHRIRTLMHDPVYRLGVAWQNVAYNQPPHTSFFLGEGMTTPPAPSIAPVGAPEEPSAVEPPRVHLRVDHGDARGPHDGDLTLLASARRDVGDGAVWEVYENGELVHAELASSGTLTHEVVGREPGRYRWVVELVNDAGTSASNQRTVVVKR